MVVIDFISSEYIGLGGAFFWFFFSLVLAIYALYRIIQMINHKEKFEGELSLIKLILTFFINLSMMMYGIYYMGNNAVIISEFPVISVIVYILISAVLISLIGLILGIIEFRKINL